MIKVTSFVPRDEIRQAFMENRLEVDSTAASPMVQKELRTYLGDLEKEALHNRQKESEHGAQLHMQNNQIGQRESTYQRLRVQRRLQPHSG